MAEEFEQEMDEAQEEIEKADKAIDRAEEEIEVLEEMKKKKKEEGEEDEKEEKDDEETEEAEVTTTVISPEIKEKKKEEPVAPAPKRKTTNKIFSIKTTANREEQVVDFLAANAEKKGFDIYAVIRPHGMRSYIFIEASSLHEAEQAAYEVPYARGVLRQDVPYEEIEHMVEIIKKEVNIQKGDIAEIISGPFKREKCKVTKIDKEKEDVVVELLESAVPIPITLKTDALKVIRRDDEDTYEG